MKNSTKKILLVAVLCASWVLSMFCFKWADNIKESGMVTGPVKVISKNVVLPGRHRGPVGYCVDAVTDAGKVNRFTVTSFEYDRINENDIIIKRYQSSDNMWPGSALFFGGLILFFAPCFVVPAYWPKKD